MYFAQISSHELQHTCLSLNTYALQVSNVMHQIITDYWRNFFVKETLEPWVLKIWTYCKYLKCFSELKLFDGRTLRIIRTHPEELLVNKIRPSKNNFLTFSEKVVGDHEIVKLMLQKSVGDRFDHYKHSGNILQQY